MDSQFNTDGFVDSHIRYSICVGEELKVLVRESNHNLVYVLYLDLTNLYIEIEKLYKNYLNNDSKINEIGRVFRSLPEVSEFFFIGLIEAYIFYKCLSAEVDDPDMFDVLFYPDAMVDHILYNFKEELDKEFVQHFDIDDDNYDDIIEALVKYYSDLVLNIIENDNDLCKSLGDLNCIEGCSAIGWLRSPLNKKDLTFSVGVFVDESYDRG